MNRTRSAEVFAANRQYLPGGCVSMNRLVSPEIAMVKGQGAHLWDADGNRYIDYHAAFGPYLLGHRDLDIEKAVIESMQSGETLSGTGTTPWEGEAARLLCQCVPSLERVQFTNTGSEATYLAIRLARAFTGRDHIIVMQGGYNGWHDEVACNVMTPLSRIGPRVSPGEYPFVPMSAGTGPDIASHVHIINFNDLDSIEWVLSKFPVACVLTEPILQNIGVVKPLPGYLLGLREACSRHGSLLILDEVKTGFRHGLGGCQGRYGVSGDLAIYGKAIANGFPLGAIGGRSDVMDLFQHPDPDKRVMIAGTYNGHPVPMTAAITTMRKLIHEESTIYPKLDQMTQSLCEGIAEFLPEATVVRETSAFSIYFMDHSPVDWHDLALNHDMEKDVRLRKAMIEEGIYIFPLATKQISVSAAHTEEDVQQTLQALSMVRSML